MVVPQSEQKVFFLVPNGEGLPLLENIEVPLGVRSCIPVIDETVVGGAAIGFD